MTNLYNVKKVEVYIVEALNELDAQDQVNQVDNSAAANIYYEIKQL